MLCILIVNKDLQTMRTYNVIAFLKRLANLLHEHKLSTEIIHSYSKTEYPRHWSWENV